MKTETKWVTLIVSLWLLVFVVLYVQTLNRNTELYRECLEANKKLLDSDPKRISTNYCRY